MGEPTKEELAELGAAFYSLGAKPEYSSDDLQKWIETQSDLFRRERGEVPVKSEPEQHSSQGSDESQKLNVQSGMSCWQVNTPRLPVFSGEAGKGDVSYTHWRYDVKCLLGQQSDANILSLIRRSLKGTASDVLQHLGENVDVKSVLAKFDIVFGNVFSAEQLLEQLYSAKQLSSESVAVWGCRLEEIVNRAQERKAVPSESVFSMLRSKFWSGLNNVRVKEALRHHYDSGMSYDCLLREARAIELDFMGQSNVVCQQTSVFGNLEGKVDVLLSKIGGFESRLQKLEQNKGKFRGGGKCFKCSGSGHFARDCPKKKQSGKDQTPAPGDQS